MKSIFATRVFPKDITMVLLLIRVITGYAFILHGWGKIQNPMGWMGPDSFIPGIFQALGALSEFGGGILLILGLFTRLSALGLLVTMVVAAGMHAFVLGDPFVSKGGGSFEPATVYFLISLLIFVMGPGSISLDKKLFGIRA